jgi:DNA-directed RNA polymerase specialized sigma24 family protein
MTRMTRSTGAASGKDGMTGADEDFAEFARASYGGLRHAAYLLTGDRHVAEDAAQTALVRTYAAWSRVRRDDAYAYARKVLVNHVTDRWRRRLREYPVGELPEPASSPTTGTALTRPMRWRCATG